MEATLDRLKIGMPERHFLPLMFGPLRVLFDDFSDDEKQQLVVQLKRLGLKVDAAAAHRRVERGR